MKKVLTYGTFDLFHRGHYNIIKRARDMGDYLIVGVTSESFDIERGKLNVRDSLMKRIENVRATGLVDEIIIEEYQGQKVHDIIKHNVDVFVVGSDWIGKFDYLKEYCEVHYLERTKSISSTMLREQQYIRKIGIITDQLHDKDVVQESKYISGISIERVFAEDASLAKAFCDKYELSAHETELESFFKDTDIVFLNVSNERREDYVRAAIEHHKHVICPAPIVADPEKMREYIQLAKERQVLMIDNIITGYLRAFTQMVWLLRGGLIGDIVRVHCSLSAKQFKLSDDLKDMLTYPLFLCLRLLGMDSQGTTQEEVRDATGEIVYRKLLMKYPSAVADIDISSLSEMRSGVTILGTKGRVEIPDDWWNMGYFEAYDSVAGEKKRFSYNFEGNGMRYLLQEASIMLQDGRKSSTKIFADEVVRLAAILFDLNEASAAQQGKSGE